MENRGIAGSTNSSPAITPSGLLVHEQIGFQQTAGRVLKANEVKGGLDDKRFICQE